MHHGSALFGWSSIQPRRIDREYLQIGINIAGDRSVWLLKREAFLGWPVNNLRVKMGVANFGYTLTNDAWQRHYLQWRLESEVTRGQLELFGHLKNLIWIDGMLRGGLAKRRDRRR